MATENSVVAPAFLLTWNPDKWEWTELGEHVADIAAGRPPVEPWSTGSKARGIREGDRVYLLRQGTKGRGLVGSGEAIRGVDAPASGELIFQAPHWDGGGGLANYVTVRWDCLLDPADRLPTGDLQSLLPEQNWTPFSSGTQVRPEVAAQLESIWSAHIDEAEKERGGQRRLGDARRRKAIEDAAQDWLMNHYRADGWDVRDTRYAGPYDAIATRGEAVLFLEAKGTQGTAGAVFLTRGEVDHARRNAGRCIIGIWSGMRFTDEGEIDQFAGEELILPFEPDDEDLSALQYRWQVPMDD